MARTEARLRCSIWEDEDYRSLTMEAQWLYEAILTQKDLSLCGVLTWTPKRFAKLASNLEAKTMKRALDLLREKRYVVVDDDTDELWVRTFVQHDRVISQPNSVIGMTQDFGAIHSDHIRQGLLQGLGQGFLDELPQRFPQWLQKGFDKRLAEPFRQAFALTYARASPRAPVPPASSLQPPASVPEHQSSSEDPVVGDASPDDDDGAGTLKTETVALVAERRFEAQVASGKHIGNPSRYRQSVLDSVESELGFDIERLLMDGHTPREVADRVQPLPKPAVRPAPTPEPQTNYPDWQPPELTEPPAPPPPGLRESLRSA